MGNQGWAFIGGGVSGLNGSIQVKDGVNLSGSGKFTYDPVPGPDTNPRVRLTGTLDVSGSLALAGDLEVSGALYANEFHVNVVNKTVSNIEQLGSTQFGDSNDDTHHFNGLLSVSGAVDVSGSILPDGDDVHNLGSSAKRWANVYTGDLHLRNERGDWTILEEEYYLCVVNNKTGKKYKMMLQEIDD